MILDEVASKLLKLSTFSIDVRTPSFAVAALGLIDALTNDVAFYARGGVLYDRNGAAVLALGGTGNGAGGAVTQGTSKSTGVTLNTITGQITMHNASLAAGAEAGFTFTNSKIAANDVVAVSIKSGGTTAAYATSVTATAAGSCEITLGNLSGGSLGEAVVLNFVVLKGANS